MANSYAEILYNIKKNEREYNDAVRQLNEEPVIRDKKLKKETKKD